MILRVRIAKVVKSSSPARLVDMNATVNRIATEKMSKTRPVMAMAAVVLTGTLKNLKKIRPTMGPPTPPGVLSEAKSYAQRVVKVSRCRNFNPLAWSNSWLRNSIRLHLPNNSKNRILMFKGEVLLSSWKIPLLPIMMKAVVVTKKIISRNATLAGEKMVARLIFW